MLEGKQGTTQRREKYGRVTSRKRKGNDITEGEETERKENSE